MRGIALSRYFSERDILQIANGERGLERPRSLVVASHEEAK